MRIVDIYSNGIKAGELLEKYPGKGYEFRYDTTYLHSDSPHISVTMPKRETPYTADGLFPFFFNMLPEGFNKNNLCRYYKIDENDAFGLLQLLADGGEFVGAVEARLHNIQ